MQYHGKWLPKSKNRIQITAKMSAAGDRASGTGWCKSASKSHRAALRLWLGAMDPAKQLHSCRENDAAGLGGAIITESPRDDAALELRRKLGEVRNQSTNLQYSYYCSNTLLLNRKEE